MPILKLILFMGIIFPFILLNEGVKIFSKIIPETDPKWKMLYFLFIALIFLAIFLWFSGVR